MTFAVGIPAMLLLLPAGVLSDRVDRRGLLMTTQALSLVVVTAATALIVTGLMDVGLAVLVALGAGASTALGTPVRTAIMPSLVERERLMNAIVMSTMGQNIMMVAGPALGGAAIRLWGIEAGFAIQAVAYGIGLLTLVPLRVPAPAFQVRRRPVQELVEGLEFVIKHPEIRVLVVMLVVSGLLMLGPVFALLPPIVRDDLGRDAFAASMLFGVMGLGMLSTSVVLATLGNFGSKGGWFVGNLAVGGLVLAGMGLTQSYALLCVLMFAWGMGGGVFINLNRTLIQSHTPDAIMGRVMSIHSLGMVGFMPLGGLAAGALAGPLGAAGCLLVAGLSLTAVSVAVFIGQPSLRRMD